MTLQDKDSAIPNNMVEFALHMTQECERISKKFYEEADKTPDLDIKIRSSQQGTIYSNMQILVMVTTKTISVKGEGQLDKEATLRDDLFDAFRMSLLFWH